MNARKVKYSARRALKSPIFRQSNLSEASIKMTVTYVLKTEEIRGDTKKDEIISGYEAHFCGEHCGDQALQTRQVFLNAVYKRSQSSSECCTFWTRGFPARFEEVKSYLFENNFGHEKDPWNRHWIFLLSQNRVLTLTGIYIETISDFPTQAHNSGQNWNSKPNCGQLAKEDRSCGYHFGRLSMGSRDGPLKNVCCQK